MYGFFSEIAQKFRGIFSSEPRLNTVYSDQFKLSLKDAEKLEKAFKFYLFCRQKGRDRCTDEIQQRLTHAGHVAFSLITTYMNEREFKLEYMEFINNEIKELMDLSGDLKELTVQPSQIDDLQLNNDARFRFTDEEENRRYTIEYYPEERECKVVVEEGIED